MFFFWNSLAFSMIQWMLELDLIECLKNYGWSFVTCAGGSDQDHPQEKEMQKSKMAV